MAHDVTSQQGAYCAVVGNVSVQAVWVAGGTLRNATSMTSQQRTHDHLLLGDVTLVEGCSAVVVVARDIIPQQGAVDAVICNNIIQVVPVARDALRNAQSATSQQRTCDHLLLGDVTLVEGRRAVVVVARDVTPQQGTVGTVLCYVVAQVVRGVASSCRDRREVLVAVDARRVRQLTAADRRRDARQPDVDARAASDPHLAAVRGTTRTVRLHSQVKGIMEFSKLSQLFWISFRHS